jgi:hypothetical protein
MKVGAARRMKRGTAFCQRITRIGTNELENRKSSGGARSLPPKAQRRCSHGPVGRFGGRTNDGSGVFRNALFVARTRPEGRLEACDTASGTLALRSASLRLASAWLLPDRSAAPQISLRRGIDQRPL